MKTPRGAERHPRHRDPRCRAPGPHPQSCTPWAAIVSRDANQGTPSCSWRTPSPYQKRGALRSCSKESPMRWPPRSPGSPGADLRDRSGPVWTAKCSSSMTSSASAGPRAAPFCPPVRRPREPWPASAGQVGRRRPGAAFPVSERDVHPVTARPVTVHAPGTFTGLLGSADR